MKEEKEIKEDPSPEEKAGHPEEEMCPNSSTPEETPPPEAGASAGPESGANTGEEKAATSEEVKTAEEEAAERLESLRKECEDYKERYLRKHADFENYRKRMIKEKEETVKYGTQELLRELIPVIDNVDLALGSTQESEDFGSFKKGVEMIGRTLQTLLKQYGLERIDMEKEKTLFDPKIHEALQTEEDAKIKEPVVLEVFQPGYKLYERILRPAKVKVAMTAGKNK